MSFSPTNSPVEYTLDYAFSWLGYWFTQMYRNNIPGTSTKVDVANWHQHVQSKLVY